MVRTVTATYARRDENWTVQVSGLGRRLDAEASGIVAARDRADQLVDELVSGDEQPTVVHLIDGSAVEFTSTYMAARLARAEGDGSPETSGKTARAAETTTGTARADTGTQAGTTDTVPADGTGSTGSDAAENGTTGTTGAAARAARAEDEGSGAEESDTEDETSDTEAAAAPLRMRTHAVPRKELSRTPKPTPENSSEAAPAEADEPAYAHAAQ